MQTYVQTLIDHYRDKTLPLEQVVSILVVIVSGLDRSFSVKDRRERLQEKLNALLVSAVDAPSSLKARDEIVQMISIAEAGEALTI